MMKDERPDCVVCLRRAVRKIRLPFRFHRDLEDTSLRDLLIHGETPDKSEEYKWIVKEVIASFNTIENLLNNAIMGFYFPMDRGDRLKAFEKRILSSLNYARRADTYKDILKIVGIEESRRSQILASLREVSRIRNCVAHKTPELVDGIWHLGGEPVNDDFLNKVQAAFEDGVEAIESSWDIVLDWLIDEEERRANLVQSIERSRCDDK